MNSDMTATYREEFIAMFEQDQSSLRRSVNTGANTKGSSAEFLVDGASPPGSFDLTEWHDLTRRTAFNIHTSQGDDRRIMQNATVSMFQRRIDRDIIGALSTAPQSSGAAVTASLSLVLYGLVTLRSEGVPLDGNIFAAITPAFLRHLMQTKEFGSAELVRTDIAPAPLRHLAQTKEFGSAELVRPDGVDNALFSGTLATYRWAGVNFIVHQNLPGNGTTAEKCFMWHKGAVGHACDISSADVAVGYEEDREYSWARTSLFTGAQLLQPNGVFVMNHDGSEYSTSHLEPEPPLSELSWVDLVKDLWKAIFTKIKKDTPNE